MQANDEPDIPLPPAVAGALRRREFLALSGAGVMHALTGCAAVPGSGSQASVYRRLLAQNDAGIARLLRRQQVGPGHPQVGGVPDRNGLYGAGSAAGVLRAMAVGYTAAASRYFQDPELRARMELAAAFLRRQQHADGTIDLLTTNFHSPPDTGFVLEWVTAATGLLRRAGEGELAALRAELATFIEHAAGALAVGGVHTPNHRWVVCMALARAHSLFPDPRYVARIDAWLGEGIDIDADGQFTERSTAIYSPLTDRCLITVARLLQRPALLEPVRRNLAMTLYYVHADGEVATEGSRRQDQYRRGSLAPYYYPYRYMAQHDGDRRFAAMARWIERTALARLTRDAVFFAEAHELRRELPPDAPLPERYAKHFRHSDLVRIRRGTWSATILAKNPTFFSLHRGSAAVAVRVAAAFFGKGQFQGEGPRRVGGAWQMEQRLEGPYWQPLAPARRTGANDWAKVVRETRQPSEVQKLRSVVSVAARDDGFAVTIEIGGTDWVPVSVELGFRRGGRLAGAGLVAVDGAPESWLLESGDGVYRYGGDELRFGPGLAPHRWAVLRGALPKLDGDSVYLTGFTPFRTTLEFR